MKAWKLCIPIIIISIAVSCAWLKDKAIEKGKDVAANTVEDKTEEAAKYLKDKYGINLSDGIDEQAKQIILEELKQGRNTSETLKNSLKGLLMILLAQGGTFAWSYLKGKSFKEALSYLTNKIEKAHIEGKTVEELKGMLKTPDEKEKTQAIALTTFVNKKFPLPTLKKRKEDDQSQ